ncbi:MAG: DUF5615 family PIN-like protein [Armatimonadetes bacterium]|nr:DUF5615 family PIN-like protein [Armatimonadota bacterium]
MLSLLLDEHISPVVVEQIRAKDPSAQVISIHQWHKGDFLDAKDDTLLEAAWQERKTLITYDQTTIRPLLKEWGETAHPHAGVVFIDEKTIASNDYGGLVQAILSFWQQAQAIDFENGVLFLQVARNKR